MIIYSLLSIFILIISITFTSPTTQQVSSIKSQPVEYLYSFAFRDDTVLIGGNLTVEIVGISDLTLGDSRAVPITGALPVACGIEPSPYCVANVIDHLFEFNRSFLACGSNGGGGSCALFEDATTFAINNISIHLSGNVGPRPPLKADYVKNSIYYNPSNEVIYSLYTNAQNQYSLDVSNFTDFANASTPTNASVIPLIIESNLQENRPSSINFFYNAPTPGNIFKYSYDNSSALEYIHIPFTEVVLEDPLSMDLDYTFLLGSFHGRLARICANDLGQFTSTATFGTFNKITIDCRQLLGIRYPSNTYYVSIALKELFIIDSDNIFGFFTSQNTAEEFIQSSAVCKFISDTNSDTETFNLESGFNDFYFDGYDVGPLDETTWNCADPENRVTNPSPANLFAATITKVLHRRVVYNQASLAFDKHFESVVRDTTTVMSASGSEDIVLFYATTNDGYIIKMKVDTDISLLGEFCVTDSVLFNAEIREFDGVKYLFAISNDQLLKISLQLCSHYDSAVDCQRDPECVWTKSNRSCNQYNTNTIRANLTIGPIDDTCRISLLESTQNTLIFSLFCDVTLPTMTPNFTIVTLNNTAVSGEIYDRVNQTYATVSVGGLEPLTLYIITAELDYEYGFVPDLTARAYTEANLEGIDIVFNPVCATTVDGTTITLDNLVPFPAYLQVCATCGSNQFCSVLTSLSSVAFEFPWINCIVTTESFTSQGVTANSSSCGPISYNRCDGSSSLTHLDFSFESTSTTITAILHDGISMQQYGITDYKFTINGTQQTLTDNTVVFSLLTPSTPYTVMYNATTECGHVSSTSRTVTTQADWPRVENCVFSSDGQTFSYTISDPTLCLGNLTNCMDNTTSNCGVTLRVVNGNTLTYDVTLATSTCAVTVYPVGRSDLLSYYGCVERFSPPITHGISIDSSATTTNSVSFNFTIISSSQYFLGQVRLLNTANNIVQEYSLPYQLTGTFASGFYDLEQSTTYKMEISVGDATNSLEFITDRSVLGLRCSPLLDYNIMFVGGNYSLIIDRNNDCPVGTEVTHICLYRMDDNTTQLYKFPFASHTIDLDREICTEKCYAFALVENATDATDCPPFPNSAYRYLCVYQTPPTGTSSACTTIPTTTPPTTTAPTPPTPTDPPPVVLSAIIMFYTAIGTSSITVVLSAGSLSVMFGLIIVYPKLLKKFEESSNTKSPTENDAYEMGGLNPMEDTPS